MMSPQPPECEIVIRAARASDLPARVELVRRGLTDHDFEAFLMFFFQELTLQVCVLGGAVLFIFAGASPAACALLLPAAALLVAAAAGLAHRARAAQAAPRLRRELAGVVAELRGPLLAGAPPPRPRLRLLPDAAPAPAARLVGTASVSEAWGPRRAGWLHALAVDARWRRRGVGAALLAGASARAAAARLPALEAGVSALQDAARGLLHSAGWTTLASFHRPVLGAALTLPMTHLTVDLPLA